ncbi:MAG: hypothetical protein EA348_01315 [Pseudomonadaceae bacterium]|nr:MAG: hypothetical protein EA348_01315 [Pseudomonadaceae bacterium]
MNIYRMPAFLLCASLAASHAFAADNRAEHFQGLSADSWSQALEHLQEYNQLLNEELSGPLDAGSMTRIHELTYTLENALQKMQKDINDAAEKLEELHVASESYQPDAVEQKGQIYLEAVQPFQRAK